MNRTTRATTLPRPSHTTVVRLEALEERCLLSNVAPVFVTPLTDQYFTTATAAGGLTIGVDASDADADALTITAESDNAGITAVVQSSTQFARLHFVTSTGVAMGDIVVQLFGNLAPLAVERFITLATNHVAANGDLDPAGVPYYTDVLVHRVVPDFMIQTGDAENGDGTGGSPLPNFADEFTTLGFGAAGALAMANSGANTNDSQFFITAAATDWLNGVHTIFGQMISGQAVYDTLINLPRNTTTNRPNTPPKLQSVEVFEGHEDGSITFNVASGFLGQANVTVTLDDGAGHLVEQTIKVGSLGARPTVPTIVTQYGAPGQTLAFASGIVDDGGAALNLTASVTKLSATAIVPTASIDPASGQVTVIVPGNFAGVAKITLSAVEAGFTGLTPSTGSFLVVSQTPDGPQMEGMRSDTGGYPGLGGMLVGDLLYSASFNGGLQIFNVSDPAHISLLNTMPTGQNAYDVIVTGHTALVADTASGLVAVNVTDPAHIPAVQKVSPGNVGVGLAVAGNVAYVALYENAGAGGGLAAYDISDPAAIHQIGTTLKTLAPGITLRYAVDVVINGAYAYVTDLSGAVVVIDVSDPANMRYVTNKPTGGSPWGMDLSGNRLYVANGVKGLLVFDVTNPANPRQVGKLATSSSAWKVTVANKVAIVAVDDGYQFVNVMDPSKMYVENTFYAPDYGTHAVVGSTRIILPMGAQGMAVLDGTNSIQRLTLENRTVRYQLGAVKVTLSIKGGKAYVYFAAPDSLDMAAVDIATTTAATTFSIATSGGNVTLGSGVVEGSLKSFTAKTTDLLGDLTFQGGLTSLALHDATGADIAIGAPAAVGNTLSMTFGRLADVSIVSQSPIKSFTAIQWDDTDAVADSLEAPSLATLKITGNKTRLLAGDLLAGLHLTGDASGKPILSSATIAGAVGGQLWDIDGLVGTVKVSGTIDDWTLQADAVKSLQLGEVARATVAVANTLGSVRAKRWSAGSILADMLGSLSITGATGIAGDLGADLTVTAGAQTANTPALGTVSVAGEVTGGTWQVDGNAKGVTVGSADDSWVASFGGTLPTLTSNHDLAGTVSALAVGNLTVKGNMDRAYLTLGDVSAAEAPLPTVLALKNLTVKGWMRDSWVQTYAHVGTVALGGMEDSSFFAGVATPADADVDGVWDLPAGADFNLLLNVKSFTVKGLTGQPNGMINSTVAAWNLGTVSLFAPKYDNATVPFGLSGHSLTKLTRRDAGVTYTWPNTNPAEATGPNAVDSFEVILVP